MGRIAAADSLVWEDLLERDYGCAMPHCLRFANCLFDGVPYCLGCADLVLERLMLVSMVPRLRGLLPALDDDPFVNLG